MTEWKGSSAIMNETGQKDETRLLRSVGLCVRAGKAIFGTPMVCEAMRRGGKQMPVLVLEAGDTSENTHKKLTDKCQFYGVRHVRLSCSGEILAAAVGKTGALAAVAITDKEMSRMAEQSI